MTPFSLHFSGMAWAQIGALEGHHFERLQDTLEYYAEAAAFRLARGEPLQIDACVPITAGPLVAECQFDDFAQSITVTRLLRWDQASQAA